MERRYKRPFDLIILFVAHIISALLLVWMLLWVLIPLLIWLEDRGQIFYRQSRLGKDGRVFTLIKFRTMAVDAEKETGAVWATARDPRVTRIGRILRATHLDEYPQVINIVRGEMSIVGPRPERPELYDRISRDLPGFEQRLRVRPGIAGLAQISGSYDLEPSQKLRYDLEYIRRMSLRLDIWLIILSLETTMMALPKLYSGGWGRKLADSQTQRPSD